MSAEIAIRLENVSKHFKLYRKPGDRLKEMLNPLGKKYHKRFQALKDIQLEVKKGEVLAIVGRNGSGKSTLLKLISGVMVADTGEISVNGKIAALLELGIGFNPEFTGRENLFFYNSIVGVADEDMEDCIEQALAFADIGEYIDQPFKTYSSGMKSRLGFAAAIQVDPDILIVDEVLAVGDNLFKQKCYKKINEFLQQGKTVLLVTHSIHTVNKFATRAILLDEHTIVRYGESKAVTQEYMKRLYKTPEAVEPKHVPVPVRHDGVDKHPLDYKDELVTEPIVIMDTNKVRLGHMHIVDSQQLAVNILHTGQSYELRMPLEFDEELDANELLIGFTFVNSQGIRVCGLEAQLEQRDDGSWLASKHFDCCMNRDLYTVLVSSRLRTHEVVFYNRVEEFTAFQVIQTDGSFRWGLVQI